jgi:predicted metalloprotease
MRWKGRRESSNVEDRRGRTTKGMVGGGIGSIIIILAIYLFGGDPMQLINTSHLDNSGTTSSYEGTAEENELAKFVSVVLAETEDVWIEIFHQEGIVVFISQTRSLFG